MVRAIVKYDNIVHGSASKKTSQAKKLDIYHRTTFKVNALGFQKRTPTEISKQWNDIKRSVRDKLSKIKQHVQVLEGDQYIKLTESEEAIAAILHHEQVEGLEGVDSLLYERETGV